MAVCSIPVEVRRIRKLNLPRGDRSPQGKLLKYQPIRPQAQHGANEYAIQYQRVVQVQNQTDWDGRGLRRFQKGPVHAGVGRAYGLRTDLLHGLIHQRMLPVEPEAISKQDVGGV